MKAFEKVCYRRREYSCNNDIWELRHNWNTRRPELLEELNSGTYKFDCVKEVVIDGQLYNIWAARDAVVIEALTMLLKDKYNITENCNSYHLKGRGGIKAALNQTERCLANNKFVMKSDVKKYYASLDHDILMNLIREYVNESPVTQLIYQFLKHVKYRNGNYVDVRRGICRGTALSPLLGALYLKPLDQAMGKMNVAYVRYMDDWIVMSTNRWTFARAVKKVNRTINNLKLEKAHDKTFIGTVKRGFDFLGFHFGLAGRTLSGKSVQSPPEGRIKFAENIAVRLCKAEYDRYKTIKGGNPIPESVSLYVKRFTKWVNSTYEWKTGLCETSGS